MASMTRRLFRRATCKSTRLVNRTCRLGVQHLERRDTPAPFTPGNLVIYRVGEGGSTLLANSGSAVFLDEYTRFGTLVQSIQMPSTSPTTNLVSSGTATTEGLLSLSPDGKFLALAGYNATLPGTINLATSTTMSFSRSAAIVDSLGNSTITAFTNAFSGGNPRGATTSDGSRVWLSGSNSGVLTGLVGPATATTTVVSTTNTNLRGIAIFDGQLYDTSGASTVFRIGQVGVGLPTASGTVTTSIPGVPTNAGTYNGFSFLDLDPAVPGVDTLYAAEETDGFRKFSFDGTTWTARGNVAVPSNFLRGMTAHRSGNCVLLYGTNASGANSTLFSLTDMSGSSTGTLTGTAVAIAIAGPNTAFRGVTFTPSATTPTETLNIDTPAITVTNAVTYTVSFNAQIAGLTASNFALTTTGDVSGNIGVPTTGDGGLTWNVPVTGILGDGTLRLDLVNGTGVTPTLYFLPFACGKTVTVSNAPAVATLDVVGTVAVYYGSPGFNNNVTLNVGFSSISMSDVENIVVTPAAQMAGFFGNGTPNVFNPNAVGISEFRVKLGAGADIFTLTGAVKPVNATGGGDVGDAATIGGPVDVTGKVSVTGFESIQQAAGVVMTATTLDFQAVAIGSAIQPIISKTVTAVALGGTGGVYWQEMDGADFTLRAAGTGELNVTNGTGALRIVGTSLFSSGPVFLSSGDSVEVNAAVGDSNSDGPITVQANTDGKGAEGYVQSTKGGLFTKAGGTAISINVNPFGGTGDAVLGVGSASGANSAVAVNVGDGNVLWNSGFTIPALNSGNALTLGAFLFNFTTTGPNSSIGTAASPLQLSAGQGGQTSINGSGGGIFVTDWGVGESNFAATATGAGNVQIWAGNATNNGIVIVSPGVTTGSGSISLRADDNLFINGPIGGMNFSGPVFLEANLDGTNSQALKMSSPTNSITTSNASAMAVVINTYSQADTFGGGSVGGVVLSNITVGNGGVVIINANGVLGNSTDANRSGSITALTNTNIINTGNGMVILTAKNAGIGSDMPGKNMPTTNSLRLNITAGKISAATNSLKSSAAGENQYDASIYIAATDTASFSATTTSDAPAIGRIELSSNGPMRLHGDLKTTDGSIALTSSGPIFQDAGAIATTGPVNLSYTVVALLKSDNSMGALNIPAGLDLRVDGKLATVSKLVFDGGGDTIKATLSGVGKISDVDITNSGGVSPGQSPGILGSGNITWSGGSRFSVEVSGGAPGTGYDQLQVTGTVDIGNATLEVTDPTLLYSPAPGAKHFIILNDGNDPVMNTFKVFGEGATVTVNGVNYTLSYLGNGDGGAIGNDVVLTAPGVAGPPPTVVGAVAVNGGNQRSMVQSLTINFSEPVVLMPGAFKVEGTALGPIGDVGLNIAQLGNTVTLTFNNTGVAIDPANSLKDGKYKLTMFADKIANGGGSTLDGNGNAVSNGSPTDDVTFTFHRLFGDGDGNGAVNSLDFALFRTVFGLSGASIFDFNGDLMTNTLDFAQFRIRFGLSGYLP